MSNPTIETQLTEARAIAERATAIAHRLRAEIISLRTDIAALEAERDDIRKGLNRLLSKLSVVANRG